MSFIDVYPIETWTNGNVQWGAFPTDTGSRDKNSAGRFKDAPTVLARNHCSTGWIGGTLDDETVEEREPQSGLRDIQLRWTTGRPCPVSEEATFCYHIPATFALLGVPYDNQYPLETAKDGTVVYGWFRVQPRPPLPAGTAAGWDRGCGRARPPPRNPIRVKRGSTPRAVDSLYKPRRF